jgi:hypothetical protein
LDVSRTAKRLLPVVLGAGCVIALTATGKEWLARVPAEQRDMLATRLNAYVKAHRARDWSKLYDVVSDVGRGGVDRKTFVARMKAAHGADFANSPDLMEFRPDRTTSAGETEYDIYGCGKAQREGREFNGVALAHAVFEHNEWFFTGWTFTQFPNEPCKALSDPDWEEPGAMEWGRSMEELRSPAGAPFHIDQPKR